MLLVTTREPPNLGLKSTRPESYTLGKNICDSYFAVSLRLI